VHHGSLARMSQAAPRHPPKKCRLLSSPARQAVRSRWFSGRAFDSLGTGRVLQPQYSCRARAGERKIFPHTRFWRDLADAIEKAIATTPALRDRIAVKLRDVPAGD